MKTAALIIITVGLACLTGCTTTVYKSSVVGKDGITRTVEAKRTQFATSQEVKGFDLKAGEYGLESLHMESSALDPKTEAATQMMERGIGAVVKATTRP